MILLKYTLRYPGTTPGYLFHVRVDTRVHPEYIPYYTKKNLHISSSARQESDHPPRQAGAEKQGGRGNKMIRCCAQLARFAHYAPLVTETRSTASDAINADSWHTDPLKK